MCLYIWRWPKLGSEHCDKRTSRMPLPFDSPSRNFNRMTQKFKEFPFKHSYGGIATKELSIRSDDAHGHPMSLKADITGFVGAERRRATKYGVI